MSAVIKLSSPPTHEFWEIPVLYEDDHLLALDKPSGLLVSPDPQEPDRPSLIGLLHSGIAAAKPWALERSLTYLMNTHRLDAEASGLLLLARSKPVLASLSNLFASEKAPSTFAVVVQGAPQGDRFEVEGKLSPHPTPAGFFRVDSRRGKKSRTVFEVREKFAEYTLLKAEPCPGRAHQVRAHLRSIRLQVVGDRLYGGRPLLLSSLKRGYRLKPDRTEHPLMNRPALHAEQLSIPHPVTGVVLTISAPWPKDLTVAMKYLRRYTVGAV
jgi:RluA family pseudouridine synthase